MVALSMRRTTLAVQELVLKVAPQGGQGAARRNAWAALAVTSVTPQAPRGVVVASDGAAAGDGPGSNRVEAVRA